MNIPNRASDAGPEAKTYVSRRNCDEDGYPDVAEETSECPLCGSEGVVECMAGVYCDWCNLWIRAEMGTYDVELGATL